MGFDPYYGYGEIAEAAGVAGVMLIVTAVYYLLVFGFSILCYVLYSLGMYTIAKRRGIHNPWLAWVPVGNLWILGSISDQYQYVTQGKVQNRRKLLLGLEIALFVLLAVLFGVGIYAIVQGIAGGDILSKMAMLLLVTLLASMAMMVLAVLLTVFEYICLYNLFASCDPSGKVVYIILSIFISVTMPFLVFACRNKDLGMPPRKEAPVSPTPIDPPTEEE